MTVCEEFHGVLSKVSMSQNGTIVMLFSTHAKLYSPRSVFVDPSYCSTENSVGLRVRVTLESHKRVLDR